MIMYIYGRIRKNSPAKCYPKKNCIIIDPKKFAQIKSYNIRIFILLHELAHLLKMYSQNEADRLALQIYYTRGYPLRDAFYALTRYVSPGQAKERIYHICRSLTG